MQTLDKLLGFVFGVAVSDSLGAPVEGLKSYQIKEIYGRVKGHIDLPIRPTNHFPKPQANFRLSRTYTDDTQGLLLGFNHLARQGYSFSESAMIDELVKSYGSLRGIGKTTRNSLRIYRYNKGEFSMSPSNGGVLRSVPFILYDFDFDVIRKVSGLTHKNFAVHLGAFIYGSTIKDLLPAQGLVNKNLLVQRQIYQANNIFQKYAPELIEEEKDHSVKLLENLEKCLGVSNFSPEFCIEELGTYSKIYQSLPCAFHSFLTSENYSDCVFNAINLGGDTDSIGAFAGGLIGAHLGFEAIPARLKNIRNYDYLFDLTQLIAAKKPYDLVYDFKEVEERLTFEEAAIASFIKRKIKESKKRSSGFKTKVNGHEIKQIAKDSGTKIIGIKIGEIKNLLRENEQKNPNISKKEEILFVQDYIAKSIAASMNDNS